MESFSIAGAIALGIYGSRRVHHHQIRVRIRKYKFADGVDMHQIAYGNYKYEDGVMSWRDMINTSEEEDLFDAAFKMVCWILKNKK